MGIFSRLTKFITALGISNESDEKQKDCYNQVEVADIYTKLAGAEEDIQAGRISDAESSLNRLRTKYNV